MNPTKVERISAYTAIAIITAMTILPLLVLILTSLKGDNEFGLGNTTIFPTSLHFENYARALNMTEWGLFFRNSVVVTIITVGGSLLLNTLAGFTFARLRFQGSQFLFLLLLLSLMIPAQITIIPQFLLLKSVPFFGGNDWLGSGGTGWLDSYYALIVPGLSGAFGIFMARQFFLQMPRALDEAAYIDGAGYLRLFVYIYIPLSGPLLGTLGIFKFVGVWNDFFHPLIYTSSPSMRTIQLGLQVFRGEYQVQYNLLMAATLMVSLPIIIAFFLFQKQFIRSVVSSGVKG